MAKGTLREDDIMLEYPKIETLFVRNEDFTVTDRLKHPVIATISKWAVTEKIDGTNIRVHLDEANDLSFGGRTANAQINGDLVSYLYKTFTVEKMAALRKDADPVSITLYGEGYGAGIQKGGGYSLTKSFVLFDVLIGSRWWLKDDDVSEIAGKLGIARAPVIGRLNMAQIVSLVREGFTSLLDGATCQAEGIVARPIEPLFDNQHRRIMLKLKTGDYQKGERCAKPLTQSLLPGCSKEGETASADTSS